MLVWRCPAADWHCLPCLLIKVHLQLFSSEWLFTPCVCTGVCGAATGMSAGVWVSAWVLARIKLDETASRWSGLGPGWLWRSPKVSSGCESRWGRECWCECSECLSGICLSSHIYMCVWCVRVCSECTCLLEKHVEPRHWWDPRAWSSSSFASLRLLDSAWDISL